MVSLAKGLVPPDGTPPTVALERAFGAERIACVGGPAHAREMVETGRRAGLRLALASRSRIGVAEVFQRAGVVCEVVERPGRRRARRRRQERRRRRRRRDPGAGPQRRRAWRRPTSSSRCSRSPSCGAGRRARSSAAPAPATSSRRRWRRPRATAAPASCWPQGVPAAEIPERLGQAVEALETVRAARARDRARRARGAGDLGAGAPDRRARCRSTTGSRSCAPSSRAPARFGRPRTWWARMRDWFAGRRRRRPRPARLDRTP